jgi:hypothetical protein
MSNLTKTQALETLLSSEGWAVLNEQMNAAILQAAFQLVDQQNMTLDEIHYRRGAMWAARQFLNMPSQIKQIMDGELLMDAAMKQAASNPNEANQYN